MFSPIKVVAAATLINLGTHGCSDSYVKTEIDLPAGCRIICANSRDVIIDRYPYGGIVDQKVLSIAIIPDHRIFTGTRESADTIKYYIVDTSNWSVQQSLDKIEWQNVLAKKYAVLSPPVLTAIEDISPRRNW